jgi:hypothetical protein
MKAVIEIEFGNQSNYLKNYDYDSYLAKKTWFSKKESEKLVKESMYAIKSSIQLGYKSGKLEASADGNVARPYFGTWELTIEDDEE